MSVQDIIFTKVFYDTAHNFKVSCQYINTSDFAKEYEIFSGFKQRAWDFQIVHNLIIPLEPLKTVGDFGKFNEIPQVSFADCVWSSLV